MNDELIRDWKDHTKNPDGVRDRLQERLGLPRDEMNEEEVIETAALAVHVYGEHLGDWKGGQAFLRKLSSGRAFSSSALHRLERQASILLKCEDLGHNLSDYSEDDRFFILALAVPALTLRKSCQEGKLIFAQATELLTADSGRQELFAVMTANLVCDLLDKGNLTEDEVGFLILLAETSRTLWGRFGNSSDLDRANFRLIQAYQLSRKPLEYGSGRYPRYKWIKP